MYILLYNFYINISIKCYMKIYINIFKKSVDKLYIMIYTSINNKTKAAGTLPTNTDGTQQNERRLYYNIGEEVKQYDDN